jgi:hypothetical protein
VFQRLAFEQLHRDIRRGFEFADLIDRANIGVIDGGRSLRFTLEAVHGCAIAGHVFGQELQRNFTLQLQVFGAVHHAHATAAELLDNAIVRDNLVQHCRFKFNSG